MAEGLIGKARKAIAEAINKAKEQIEILKTTEGRNAFCSNAKGAADKVKGKIISIWKDGAKGKAIVIIVVCVLSWLVLPSCGDGKNDKPKTSSCKTRDIEVFTHHLIDQEIAKHWDDFFKPLGFTRYIIESGEAGVNARSGGAIDVIVAFEPNAKEYWKRVYSTSEDYYNTSLHMGFSDKVNPICDDEATFSKKDIEGLVEKMKHVEESTPRLYVYRKATSTEMEDERFYYRMSFSAFVMRKKDGTFALDPRYDDMDGCKAGFKEQDYKPGYGLGEFGMTADFIRRQNEYVVVALDRSGKLDAKQRAIYDVYKNYNAEILELAGQLTNLRASIMYESDLGKKANDTEKAKEVYKELNKLLDNPPVAPKF